MVAGMYVVAVVDVVMVEPDVMRITLCPILEGEFVTVFDVVFKSSVVHDECYARTGRSSRREVSLSGVCSGLFALATCDASMW